MAEDSLKPEKSRPQSNLPGRKSARQEVETRCVSAEEKSAEEQLLAARAAGKQAASAGTTMHQNSAVVNADGGHAPKKKQNP